MSTQVSGPAVAGPPPGSTTAVHSGGRRTGPVFDPVRARADAAARWAGTPLAVEHWLEGPSGFPPGGVGAARPASGEQDPTVVSTATTVVSTARGYGLTRRQLDDVLAFTEFLAGEAITAAERADVEQGVVDAFEDNPKGALRSLRPLSDGVRRVAALAPVRRAQRRLQALTTTYLLEARRQADSLDLSPVMEVVCRHNPVVRYWASTGIVIFADALAARMEQHRLVLGLVGRQVEEPAALADRLRARVEEAGRLEIAELAGSQVRLLLLRGWLRDLGGSASDRLRDDVARAVDSALDVDIVVQHVGHLAALDSASGAR